MTYAKQTWTNNVTPVDAAHMSHIEDGIAAVEAEALPQPVVNGQWVKGVGGAAVWSAIADADVPAVASGRLGVQGLAIPGNDCNQANKNGWYGISGTSPANAPPFGFGTLHVVALGPNDLRQFAYPYNVDDFWFRRCAGGTWGSWLAGQPYASALVCNNGVNTLCGSGMWVSLKIAAASYASPAGAYGVNADGSVQVAVPGLYWVSALAAADATPGSYNALLASTPNDWTGGFTGINVTGSMSSAGNMTRFYVAGSMYLNAGGKVYVNVAMPATINVAVSQFVMNKIGPA